MAHQQEHQNHGQASTSPSAARAETEADKKEPSSSSSNSSENTDEDDFFQIEGPILGSTLSFADNAAISDTRKQSSSSSSHPSGSGHAATDPKQSPPVLQAMSRAPADECPDPKRIPSSIFARSKSKSSPADWSVTSNESLFSINVGNASFSKDHLFLYGTSGELGGNPSEPLPPLPPLPRQSPSSSPMRSEVAAAPTSAGVKPATTRVGDDGDGNADYNNSLSHRSDASTTSFAFPMYGLSAWLHSIARYLLRRSSPCFFSWIDPNHLQFLQIGRWREV